jgi:hypothetical protein
MTLFAFSSPHSVIFKDNTIPAHGDNTYDPRYPAPPQETYINAINLCLSIMLVRPFDAWTPRP